MARAEKCPICEGEGKLVGLLPEDKHTCHGCGGKGWVEIQDQQQRYVPYPPYRLYPLTPNPFPARPYIREIFTTAGNVNPS